MSHLLLQTVFGYTMTFAMKFLFPNKADTESVCIYPVFDKVRPANNALAALLPYLARNGEFKPKKSHTFYLFGKVKKLPAKLVLLGLGKVSKLDATSVLESFAEAVKVAASHHPEKISVVLTGELLPFEQTVAEALTMANYHYAIYKTGKDAEKIQKQDKREFEIIGVGQIKSVQILFQKGVDIASAVNEARDWVNAPPNFVNTDFFEHKAREITKEIRADLTILNKKQIMKLGMGALLGVNRGSRDEPRFIVIDYTPKGANKKNPPIVFVGKGLIFDSGGYNLKPRGHIENMQLDKAGAITVFALMKILPRLGIKHRVVGMAPFTENLIGKDALKPSEILKTYSGKTVEITNTDAEGRLILADALAYAVDKFKPKYLIDIATLTGACVVALGERYAGLFSNDKDLATKIRDAGDETDELMWELPMHKDDCKKMRGIYADLRNSDTGSSSNAGASKGAAFLKEFIGTTKWAHLDIAGPAFVKDPKKYETKGATGFGVRALARFLEKLE